LTPRDGFARTTRCAGANSVFATSFVRSTGRMPSESGALAEPSAATAVSGPAWVPPKLPANVPSAATAVWATLIVPIVSEIGSPGTAGAMVPEKRTALP
jgi:hypothetical protein